MESVQLALRDDLPHTTSYTLLAQRAATTAMPGHDAALPGDQAASLTDLLLLMGATAKSILEHTKVYSPRPVPDPELRVRPPL